MNETRGRRSRLSLWPDGARSRLTVLCAGACAWALAGAAGATTAVEGDDLSRLSLEELAQVQITSVSRQPESVAAAAAAVFVISAEDIRRSAATNVPEVLRLAPNLQVQRIDAVSWAITARGFNSRETSNKLLVMIDGRSIYTPLYSGVAWDTHHVPLGEIERIEVISGTGGTLYGANAVNGVINIITKSAAASQGVHTAAIIGDDERIATARFGVSLGDTAAARFYVSAFDRDHMYTETGGRLGDESDGVQAGFRTDWGSDRDRFTVQGDAYYRESPNRDANQTGDLKGFNLVGRWTRAFADGSSLMVQGYYDHNDRNEFGLNSSEATWDLAFQHDLARRGRHNLIWGGGYRLVDSTYESAPWTGAGLSPMQRNVSLTNVFVRDRITLTDRIELTPGIKLEDSSLSGLEVLPSVRIGWQAADNAFLWARAARAVRTPSRIDRDLTAAGFLGPSFMDAEELIAYEVGYRGRPTANTSLTVTAFFNDYDDLRTVDTDPVTIFPIRFANSARGETYGVEVWGTWDVTDRWRLSGGFATLEKDLEPKPGSRDITGIASGGDDPDWHGQIRSRLDITDRIELDVGVRAVDDLATVDGYVEADARLGWRVTDDLEVSIAGSNLLHDRHIESDDAGRRRQIGRSIFLRLRWSS